MLALSKTKTGRKKLPARQTFPKTNLLHDEYGHERQQHQRFNERQRQNHRNEHALCRTRIPRDTFLCRRANPPLTQAATKRRDADAKDCRQPLQTALARRRSFPALCKCRRRK